jgi:hypothetical protein
MQEYYNDVITFVLHVKHNSLNQATSSIYDEIDVHTSYVWMVLRHENRVYLPSVIQKSIFFTSSKVQDETIFSVHN